MRDSTVFSHNTASQDGRLWRAVFWGVLGSLVFWGSAVKGQTNYPPNPTLTSSVKGSVSLTGAEIPAFDPDSKRAFVSSGTGVQVVDLTDPAAPVFVSTVAPATVAAANGVTSNDVSSVAVRKGTGGGFSVVAAAIINSPKTNAGHVVFLRADTLELLGVVQVGVVPDHVTFTPDGSKVLVANEGELDGTAATIPDTVAGTVSIIDVSGGFVTPSVVTAGFGAWDGAANVAALREAGVRIYANGVPSTDFEPEYIAVSPDGTKAFVTLQEANAIGILDLVAGAFTNVVALGKKDFSTGRHDFSDRDGPGATNLVNLTTGNTVKGLYMPDGVAAFSVSGQTYYVIANEGDDRNDFLNPDDTTTVGNASYDLDNTLFPNEASLKALGVLGRLVVSNATGLRGDTDGDGDVDEILSYGGRSFSILDSTGKMVFDSGDMIEVIVSTQFATSFDDARSDNKGPEPEGVTVSVIGGRPYVFVGLERSSLVLVFDVSNPLQPVFVNGLKRTGDTSPEGLVVVSAADAPGGKPLLLTANEVSNTLTVFELAEQNVVFIGNGSVSEGDSGTKVLDLPVSRTGTVTAFTVDYVVTGGSAVSGSDYVLSSGTLTFTSGGADVQNISITVNGDTGVEGDETVVVTLSNLVNTTGTTTIGTATGTGTIRNDDFAPNGTLTSTVKGSISLTGAEIPAFDSVSKRAFVSSGTGVQVVDLTDPAAPVFVSTVAPATVGAANGVTSNDVSSVAVRKGSGGGFSVLAAAVINSPKTNAGHVVFIRTDTLELLGAVQVGVVPDHVTFTPDGSKVLVANEGELDGTAATIPDTVAGTVSIIDVSGGFATPSVTTAGFGAWDGAANVAALREAGVRIYANGVPSTDFEPEYIAVSPDGTKAFVTLQEANAIGILDLVAGAFTNVVALGKKDFSTGRHDFSDRDGPGATNLVNLTTGNPVKGLYMPDGVAAFSAGGQTYYAIANEGDDRNDFLNPDETTTVGNASYDLDNTLFPNEASLKALGVLGRLVVSNATGLRGDTDGDGDVDEILSYGGRSFSILDSTGKMVFDSGDMIEVIVSTQFATSFDDTRSDNKGPEPEGVTVSVIGGRPYVFVGLERSSLVLVFDVSNPLQPVFVNGLKRTGDTSPEGLVVVSAADAPGGKPLLLTANEVSNTLTVFELSDSVGIGSAAIAEGDSGTQALNLAVTRTGSSTAFTVDYAVTGGTATAGTDYVLANGTLTFTASGPDVQNISITVNGDSGIEADETVVVTLSNLVNTTGVTTIGTAVGTGTIQNDDVAPAITVQPASASVVSGRTAVLSVTATGSPTLTYQWYAGVSGNTTQPVSGANSASYTTPVLLANASYWVRIDNGRGTVDSATATLTVALGTPVSSSSALVLEPNTVSWNPAGVTLNGTTFVNLGLQGVGRVSSGMKDPVTGESVGSVSDMQVSGWRKNGDGTYSGRFHFLPDRGYNSGTVFSNYAARINDFDFTLTPYTGATATALQNQIAMTYVGSRRFTYDNDGNAGTPGVFTTGLLATGVGNLFGTQVPVSTGTQVQSDGSVEGRLTVDAEGLVLDKRAGKGGSGWVGDEYGASVYHFNSEGLLDGQVILPSALLPSNPAGTRNFNGTPVSGRRDNQGIEGIAQSPDGTLLFVLLQSATVQDSLTGNQGRFNTRLLVYSLSGSDTPSDPVAQYVIQLPRVDSTGSTSNGSTVDRTAAQSAIVALNNHQLLILSRDGNGRGATGSPAFKSVLLADTVSATNIDGLYDADGATILSSGALAATITPMGYTEALNLIGKLGNSTAEVEKFGLNLNAAPGDTNTVSEKWEAMALLSANDAANPNDYFLFLGNDNDFQSRTGKYLDAAGVLQSYDATLDHDTVLLVYRVRLSGPDNQPPFVTSVISDQSGKGLVAFNYTVPADLFVDPEAQTLVYSATRSDDTALPSWLSFNAATRTLSGTPTLSDVGTLRIKITGRDGSGVGALGVSTEFNVVVAEADPTFRFSPTTYTIAENGGTVALTIQRQGALTAAAVRVSTQNGTATAGTDYTAVTNLEVSFGQNETTKTVPVAVLNRTGLQSGRSFQASLSAVGQTNVPSGGASATVTVLDHVPGTVAFSQARYAGAEAASGDATYLVTLTRTVGTDGVLGALITSESGGTATENTDYTVVAETVVWQSGDASPKTIPVVVKKDADRAAAETVFLRVSTSTLNAEVGGLGTAVFTITESVDTTGPVVSIKSPRSGATISSTGTGAVLVDATAVDPIGVLSVRARVNDGVPVPMTLEGTSYKLNVAGLENGVSRIAVSATDANGNVGTATVAVTLSITNPGSVGAYNGLLEADAEEDARLARLVNGPALNHNGLIRVDVTAGQRFTGNVTMAGIRVGIKGLFLSEGTAVFGDGEMASSTLELLKPGTPDDISLGFLSMELDASNHRIIARLTSDPDAEALVTFANGVADQSVYTDKANPVLPFRNVPTSLLGVADKGNYTAVFGAKGGVNNGYAESAYPLGAGAATLNISKAGVGRVVGKLADGSAVSYANAISKDNRLPLYVQLYANKGFIWGEVEFDSEAETHDASGELLWFRPSGVTVLPGYASGWKRGIELGFEASKYVQPSTSTILGIPGATSGSNLVIRTRGLLGSTANDARINSANLVTVTAATEGQTGANALNVQFDVRTGLLGRSSFKYGSGAVSVNMVGAVLQKSQAAAGYFLYAPARINPVGNPESGYFEILEK